MCHLPTIDWLTNDTCHILMVPLEADGWLTNPEFENEKENLEEDPEEFLDGDESVEQFTIIPKYVPLDPPIAKEWQAGLTTISSRVSRVLEYTPAPPPAGLYDSDAASSRC
ncbi:hypothetical protein RIF29_00478 [Crotalaria pallida]|uniref:Uncharacterized protein n=1 Tax=Crotalaria pallida TaxID=3830 RepID=A0AAN9IWI7_CROPI